ncbi:MAG: multicopper oxidase family protein [Syntrophorhabdaceae bacterium]
MDKKKKFTRRDFIKDTSIVFAGTLIGLASGSAGARGMGGGGMGGGGTSVINPPIGQAFTDPPVLYNQNMIPGTVEVSLEAKMAAVEINGTMADLLTYNGHYPAPTIKVRNGERLIIHLKNSLAMLGVNMLGHDRDITNLHTHGLHVSPSGNADNMMTMLMSGQTFDYDYGVLKQDPGSINFYHPHIHGSVAEQYWGGMAGTIDVPDDTAALSGIETHIVFIKDITLSGPAPEPYTSMMDFMHGKEGNTVMVNGLVNPALPIRPGQVMRLRIINASNARFYKLSLEGHSLYVIGTEGGLLDKPYTMPSLLVSPGERADILIKASTTTGNYRLLSLPYSRQGSMGGQQITLMTLTNKGSRTTGAIPSIINPSAKRITAMPMKTEKLYLSMGQGKGYINGIAFQMSMDGSMVAAMVHSHLDTYEVWEIYNQSGMDHPFHQHVNSCQVLSISGGDSGYSSFYTKAPAWKDVVIIPKWGSARILLPIKDFDGMSMFHCHIVEHEDIGMMGMWHIGEMPM